MCARAGDLIDGRSPSATIAQLPGRWQPTTSAHAQWLTEVTRALFKPIPFREVFVISALFSPQLTFAKGAKLDGKLWYSPAISPDESMIRPSGHA